MLGRRKVEQEAIDLITIKKGHKIPQTELDLSD